MWLRVEWIDIDNLRDWMDGGGWRMTDSPSGVDAKEKLSWGWGRTHPTHHPQSLQYGKLHYHSVSLTPKIILSYLHTT